MRRRIGNERYVYGVFLDQIFSLEAEVYPADLTAFGVTEEPSPGQQFETELAEPTQAAEATFITTELITIIAVVIIAVVALAGFYIFRKLK